MISVMTERAHRLLAEFVQPGSVCIDATAGNGNDTEFLARSVGPNGRVYACDIQDAAIEASRRRLEQAGLADRVAWLHADHADLETLIDPIHAGAVRAILFNLGYLPGGDEKITTRTETTLQALAAAARLLAPRGILSVVLYPGHPEGRTETEGVLAWAADLDSKHWACLHSHMLNRSHTAPSLLSVQKGSRGLT